MALKTTERESASKSLVNPSQRGISKPSAKIKSKSHKTYIRPIRDRGDRFPSFIDAFCPVCDCFRLGFERFFDRFCFLQHLLNTLFFFLNAFFSFLSALLIELETLRSNSQRDDDDVRDQNLLYSFSQRERPKPPLDLSFSVLCPLSSSFSLIS